MIKGGMCNQRDLKESDDHDIYDNMSSDYQCVSDQAEEEVC